jgi:hypothetical protein
MLHDPPLIITVLVVLGIILLARAVVTAIANSRRPRQHLQSGIPPEPPTPPRAHWG